MTISSRQTELLLVSWVFGSFAVLVVVLRILAKVKIRQFKFDDAVMILALCFGLIAASLLTCGITYGYAQPTNDEYGSEAAAGRKFYVFTTVFLIACAAAGRAAFVLYLLAILGTKKWHRIILITLAVLEVAVNAVPIILIFASCKPASAVWDYQIDGICISDEVQVRFGFFQNKVFNTFVDLYLVVVPTYIFWHLNLRLPVKISLIGLMSLGLLAMAAALAKVVQVPQLKNEMLNDTVGLLRWGFIEAWLVIITASLPCLRNLILSGFRFMVSSAQRSRSYELTATVGGTPGGRSLSTTAQNTQHRRTNSRLRNILSKSNAAEGGSVDRILGSRNSVEATEASESAQALGNGIRKQVEFFIDHDKREMGGV
ncbi:uncharacterized protein ACLA_096320 [Aspergillus clavatus NRRL 1]|uniref:Rhodopsin domain-containing protein n=1 Tax=Aspergillus clavatus (strain ATCC 1007 / CBS 513.65 / DSM 816 / NCTC 3887 / NRRL 1 / QM 1276 / 107) TaxID=344612 RepID=A1CMB2_ASPCL|nr:uncharacterized protein ACLA_096320 [Aspergillus clavatus NRRL 1]EAW08699.1 conserved hypothetical protein [Aspergillus clavatus NRRL 1]